MSDVPPWKQAIFDRRKKQEEDEKRRRAEDDAYLASLPPWKRALLLKQRERQQVDVVSEPVDRSDSFGKQTSPTHQPPRRETSPRRTVSPVPTGTHTGGSASTKPSWARERNQRTPTSSGRGSSSANAKTNNSATPASSTTASHNHKSGGARQTSPPPSSTRVTSPQRRSSVTVLPEDTGLSVNSATCPPPTKSYGPVSLRQKQSPVVHVQDKRRSFEEEDSKLANIPAWKKALLLRRRATQGNQTSSPSTKPEAQKRGRSLSPTSPSAKPEAQKRGRSLSPVEKDVVTIPMSQTTEKREENSFDQKPASPIRRATSPTPRSGTQREIKPVRREPVDEPDSSVVLLHSRPITPPEPVSAARRETSPTPTAGIQRRSKPPPLDKPDSSVMLLHSRPITSPEPVLTAFDVKPSSPARAASPKPETQKTQKPSRLRTKKGTKKEQKAKESNGDSGVVLLSSRRIGSPEPVLISAPAPALDKPQERRQSPTPASRRPAPLPPSSKTTQAPSQDARKKKSSLPASSTKAKPQPEVVNRRTSESSLPGKLVDQEGITLRPPVFKEVDVWANVTEDDPKFLNLPQWKQALIRRRRADIIKRTTSPSPPSSPTGTPTGETHIHTPWSPRNSLVAAPELPQWKQELLKQRQGDRTNKPKNYGLECDTSSDRNQRRNLPTGTNAGITSPGSVRALLDRFNKGGGRNDVVSPPPRPSIVHQPPSIPASKPWVRGTTETRIATIRITPNEGDLSSEGSDEDLEEITLTNIDELSSDEMDEDDSGISTKGESQQGKTYSYSLVPDSPETLAPPTSFLVAPEEEDDQTSGFREERRPSILIDPDNKPKKVRTNYTACMCVCACICVRYL